MRGIILQLIKFCIVGASNTIIYLAIYYTFVAFRSDLYLIGNIVGWGVSVLNAWFWSRKYVFTRGHMSAVQQLVRSYLMYGGTAILGTFLLWLVVEFGEVSEFIAPWLVLVVTIPLNFLVNKYWTFR